MYFLDVLRVLRRRWLVVLIGILLVGGASGVALKVVPTQYQASGQLLLLLPVDATDDGKPINPYLNLPPGLVTTASIIAGSLTNKDAQRTLVAHGFAPDYAIALNPDAGPLLAITVQSTNAKLALVTRDQLIKQLNSELMSIQTAEAIPTRLMIHSASSSVSSEAEVLPGSKIRALAVIVAVGVIGTLVFAFVLDRAKTTRAGSAKRRRNNIEFDDEPARELMHVGNGHAVLHQPETKPGDDVLGGATPGRRSRTRRLMPTQSAVRVPRR